MYKGTGTQVHCAHMGGHERGTNLKHRQAYQVGTTWVPSDVLWASSALTLTEAT